MEYLDDVLRRLANQPGHRCAGWSHEAVRVYRETIQCVYAAKTEGDLHALRSLLMRARPDLRPGAWSIRLDDGHVLGLVFKNDENGVTAVLEVLNTNRKGSR